MARGIGSVELPTPRFVVPVLHLLFLGNRAVINIIQWLITFFYRKPLFRGRCDSVGKRFFLGRLPYVVGHARIRIGDDVRFFGKVDIFSGRIFDEPRLVIGNRVDVGHNVTFVVNREIIVEDDVNMSGFVRILDSDGHPRDTQKRAADLPPNPDEIKPVRICRYAWIGQNTFILKGVTVGEGAVVGVNSVVLTDIPPYSVAMGNPARVVVKGNR